MLTVLLVAHRAAGLVPGIAVEGHALVLAARFVKLGQAHSSPRHASLRGVAGVGGARVPGRATAEFHVVDGHSRASREAAGREGEAQFAAHGDVMRGAVARQRGDLPAILLRARVLPLEAVAGIALDVEVGFVGDYLIVYRAWIELDVIQHLALVQTVRRALADLMGRLVETGNLRPRSHGHQLFGHFSKEAGWHATIRLAAVMEQLTDLSLGAGINFAGGRDILLEADHGLVVLRVLEKRLQGNARGVGLGGRELGAQRGRRVGAGDGGPVHAASHQFQAILPAQPRLVALGFARSQLQQTGGRAQSFRRASSGHSNGQAQSSDDSASGPVVGLEFGRFVGRRRATPEEERKKEERKRRRSRSRVGRKARKERRFT